jgi:hypothetical protein
MHGGRREILACGVGTRSQEGGSSSSPTQAGVAIIYKFLQITVSNRFLLIATYKIHQFLSKPTFVYSMDT